MSNVAVPSVATVTPTSADTVLGVQGGVVKRFAVAPPFSQLAATTGANLIGYDDGEVYDAGTVGAKLADAVTSTNLTVLFTAWFSALPTSLPGTAGVLWNNGGTLSQS